MSIFGGGTNAQTPPKYTQMQLQSSAYGLIVPVVYGATRISWNLLDYLNFKSHQTPVSSGGKGGIIGGGAKGSSSTTYTASLAGLLCEGPISGVFSTWLSQTHDAGTGVFAIFDGTIAQTPWAYLTTNYPSHALTYSGFAYAAAQDVDLGTSANLPNYNWEVLAFLLGTAPSAYGGNGCYTGGDVDPSRMLPDMLASAQYGMGFPASRVGQLIANAESHSGATTITVTNAATFSYNISVYDTTLEVSLVCVAGTPASGQYKFTSGGVYSFNAAQTGHALVINYASIGALTNYQNFCLASGLWVSPAYDSQSQSSSVIDDLMNATFSEVVWSSGVLQVVPRGSLAVSANGYTFTPVNTPLFDLNEDDFMPNTNPTGTVSSSGNDDPVIVTRTRASDQINVVRIECFDRANQYAPAVVESVDRALVTKFGRRPGASKSLHMFCDVNAAKISAALQLQDEHIRNDYSIMLDERYCVLDPMDVVSLTDTQFPGMNLVGVRLLELTENDDGTISIAAEEFPGTIGRTPVYNIDVGQGYIQDYNADPGNAAPPIIFDAAVPLSGTFSLETWLATSSATGNLFWGGCDVYMSTDNSNYVKKGTLKGRSRIGVLTANLPNHVDPDLTDTLSVDLSKSLGQLLSGTQADADNDVTLCFVVGPSGIGEYISYKTATLTSTYHYGLTYLRRGQLGSTPEAHSTGDTFVRLDSSVFTIPFVPSQLGSTFYVKLVSFNIFGGGYQDISSVPAYTHTITGPPVPAMVQNFSATQNGDAIALSWTDLLDISVKGYDILYGPVGGSVATATLLTEASRQTAETTVGVPPGTWVMYIRARNIANQVGPATSAVVTVTNTNTSLARVQYNPDWLGTLVGFIKHYQGYLLPDSTLQTSALTPDQVFVKSGGAAALSLYVNPSFTAATLDEGFNSNLRAFFMTGLADLDTSGIVAQATTLLDYWLDGNTDPNTYLPWTVGYATARYFKPQLVLNTGVADGYVTSLSFELDAPIITATINNFAVSNSGTTSVSYATYGIGPFHGAPNIQVTPSDGVGTGGGALNITSTSATIQEFSGTTLISGTVSLHITGN